MRRIQFNTDRPVIPLCGHERVAVYAKVYKSSEDNPFCQLWGLVAIKIWPSGLISEDYAYPWSVLRRDGQKEEIRDIPPPATIYFGDILATTTFEFVSDYCPTCEPVIRAGDGSECPRAQAVYDTLTEKYLMINLMAAKEGMGAVTLGFSRGFNILAWQDAGLPSIPRELRREDTKSVYPR